MFFLIIIVKSHKQVLIKTILQDLLKDNLIYLFFSKELIKNYKKLIGLTYLE